MVLRVLRNACQVNQPINQPVMCLFFNSSTKLKQEETKCEKETQKSNGMIEEYTHYVRNLSSINRSGVICPQFEDSVLLYTY